MKKISNKMIVAIALVIIAMVVFYFQNIKKYKADVPVSKILVAKQTIPENTVITEEMIIEDTRYTQDLLKQKGDITSNKDKVIGKRTRVPIYEGELINLNRLIENKPYMDERDAKKKTMFVIEVENMDKALNIRPGSYIDIWLEPNQNYFNAILEGYPFIYPVDYKGKQIQIREETIADENTKNLVKNLNYFSYPLYTKLKVYDVKTEEFIDFSIASSSEGKTGTITYLTLYLTDEEIASYLDVTDWHFTKRVTLHGENVEYSIITEKIMKEPVEQAQSGENGEPENKTESIDSVVEELAN